jgi:outer membrane protein TolC
MPLDGALPELAKVEALIARAEAELAVLRQHPEREGRAPDPSDPFDPAGCLEIWLRALREHRDDILRRTD